MIIAPLRPEHDLYAQVAELLGALGSDYTAEDVEKMAVDIRSCVLGVEQHGAIVGASCARIFTLDECEEYRVPPETGFLESAILREEYQGIGIGKMMALWRIEFLRKLGCTTIAALSWESGQRYTSRPVLERLGFRMVRLIKQPWITEWCPVCQDYCSCDAALMRIDYEGP